MALLSDEDSSTFSDVDPHEIRECHKNEICSGQKFPEEVAAILQGLYNRGMTGWGKVHAGELDVAVGTTSLTYSQVKVCS